MDRDPITGRFQTGNTISQWHGSNARALSMVRRYAELAGDDFDEVYRLHIELIRTAKDERVRLAATELFYNRCLGKLTESLAISGSSSSPLPALSPETLACLVRDMQRSESPVIDVEAKTVQQNPPSPDQSNQA